MRPSSADLVVSRNRSRQRQQHRTTSKSSARLKLTYTAVYGFTLSAHGRTKSSLRSDYKGTAALCCQHAGHIPIDRYIDLERQVFATLPALSACPMAPTGIGLGWTKVRMPGRRQRSAALSGTTILSYSLICLHQRYVNMMPRHMQSAIDTCMVCR